MIARIGLLILFLTGLSAHAQPLGETLPRFEPVTAGESFPIGDAPGRERGYLIVAEDRSAAEPNPIRLPVVIVRARSGDSTQPPVLFLPGGPGIGSLSAAAYPGAYPWTADRDFIIIGRRGTEHADPALTCPAIGAALAQQVPANDPSILDAVRQCRAELSEDGIALDQYHTAAHVADLEDLRTVLDIEHWSIFALSYGTRIALSVARDHPDSLASMVLDSPLPHSARYDDESAGNLADVYRLTARACASQPACNASFPELERRFFERLEDVGTEGVDITGYIGRQRIISAAELAGSIPLTSRASLSQAPILMDAIARLDPAVFPLLFGGAGQPAGFAWGNRLSVWCSEALPFSDRARSPLPPDAFAGLDSAVFHPDVCQAWDVPERPESEITPTRSDVPTLIIAGQFDALTPPRWGADAVSSLTRGRLITLPWGFHTETVNWDGDGCAMSLAADFFTDPERFLAEAEPGCVTTASAPQFQLTQ